MDAVLTDSREHRRYEAHVNGELAALADYIPTDQLLAFTHTEVLPSFERQGIASALVRFALDDVRKQGLAALAVCPYVSAFIAKHPQEYGDLLYRSHTTVVDD